MSTFARNFFAAISNPKYYLFMTAFLPQFTDGTRSVAPQYGILAATIVAIDVSVMTIYALVGVHFLGLWKATGRIWLQRVSGTLLLALAGYVALYGGGAL